MQSLIPPCTNSNVTITCDNKRLQGKVIRSSKVLWDISLTRKDIVNLSSLETVSLQTLSENKICKFTADIHSIDNTTNTGSFTNLRNIQTRNIRLSQRINVDLQCFIITSKETRINYHKSNSTKLLNISQTGAFVISKKPIDGKKLTLALLLPSLFSTNKEPYTIFVTALITRNEISPGDYPYQYGLKFNAIPSEFNQKLSSFIDRYQ